MTNDEIIEDSRGEFKVAVAEGFLQHLTETAAVTSEKIGCSIGELAHELTAIIIHGSDGKAHVVQQKVTNGTIE